MKNYSYNNEQTTRYVLICKRQTFENVLSRGFSTANHRFLWKLGFMAEQ